MKAAIRAPAPRIAAATASKSFAWAAPVGVAVVVVVVEAASGLDPSSDVGVAVPLTLERVDVIVVVKPELGPELMTETMVVAPVDVVARLVVPGVAARMMVVEVSTLTTKDCGTMSIPRTSNCSQRHCLTLAFPR
jgi:hypothetical protein